MDSILLFKDKYVYRDGAIREMIIWRLPKSDKERPHGLKYRLYYGFQNQCLVRYDNEKGKGDHRHYGSKEENYVWVSVEKLMQDFKKDIEKVRGAQNG